MLIDRPRVRGLISARFRYQPPSWAPFYLPGINNPTISAGDSGLKKREKKAIAFCRDCFRLDAIYLAVASPDQLVLSCLFTRIRVHGRIEIEFKISTGEEILDNALITLFVFSREGKISSFPISNS